MLKESVQQIIDEYSVAILLDGKRFCSLLADMSPSFASELKVIRRIETEGLLSHFYKILTTDKDETVSVKKMIHDLEESGFSDKWIEISLNAFGLDNRTVQVVDNNSEHKMQETNDEITIAKELVSSMRESGLDDDLIDAALQSFELPKGVDVEMLSKQTAKSDLEHKTQFEDFRKLLDKTLVITHRTSVEKSEYGGRSDIEMLIIAKGVENIKQNAFANCSNLKCIFLPRTVKSIAKNAFANCKNLMFIEYEYSDAILREVRKSLDKIDGKRTNEYFYVSEQAFDGCANLLFILGSVYDFAAPSCVYKSKVILHHDVLDTETESEITEILRKFGANVLEEYVMYSRCYNMIAKEKNI